jgi:prepilin-type N-terminal cleavage/methylation domain-containing protein
MPTHTRQQGFTLIEIMVVVMIVAMLSAMSLLAINQAFDRRYVSQADRLLIWLQQLAENSALQGAAYGIVAEESPSQLRAVIYYRNRWVAVTAPAPFPLTNEAEVDWLVQFDSDEELLPQQTIEVSADIDGGIIERDEEEFLLPEIAFLPDGYIEPEGEIRLRFSGIEDSFIYSWESGDDLISTMVMERRKR